MRNLLFSLLVFAGCDSLCAASLIDEAFVLAVSAQVQLAESPEPDPAPALPPVPVVKTSPEKSIVVEKPAAPQYRNETRYHYEYRKGKCNGRYCPMVRVRVAYTVKVPVVARGEWPSYPTTNKKIYRLNGGKGPHADWKHLTQGEHKGAFNHDWLRSLSQSEIEALHSDHHMSRVQWSHVVRP
jgi:hypothetical protein